MPGDMACDVLLHRRARHRLGFLLLRQGRHRSGEGEGRVQRQRF